MNSSFDEMIDDGELGEMKKWLIILKNCINLIKVFF